MTSYCCLKVEDFEEGHKPSKNKLFLGHPVCFKVYVTWLYLIFMYILPFSLLAVFNILIYRSELLVWSFNWIFAGRSDEPRRYEPPSLEAKKGKLVGTFFLFAFRRQNILATQVWRWRCPAFCFFSSAAKETKNKEIIEIKKDEIRNRQKYICNTGLAMMLLCVVLVFFLCNILALVVNVLEVIRDIRYLIYLTFKSSRKTLLTWFWKCQSGQL